METNLTKGKTVVIKDNEPIPDLKPDKEPAGDLPIKQALNDVDKFPKSENNES